MKYLILCMTLFIAACNDDLTMTEQVTLPVISDVNDAAWRKLSEKKIYFGHQSVGDNILDGIKAIMESNNVIKLNIQKLSDIESFNVPVFAQSYIGKNEDIDSKLNSFAFNIRNRIGGKVDIAFLKLCFWDIRRNTNIYEVFNKYKKTIDELQIEYPGIIFLHFTVPLMSHSTNLIDTLKRIIKADNSDLDNIKRNEFNNLILHEYGGKAPLFDIALIESTLPNGRRAFFTSGENKYYYLPDEYTNDGGHLNEHARKYVAEQLLITLSRLAVTSAR